MTYSSNAIFNKRYVLDLQFLGIDSSLLIKFYDSYPFFGAFVP